MRRRDDEQVRSRPRRTLTVGLTMMGAVATAGACTAPRMVVPKDVAGTSEEIVITDRSAMSGALADESFTMGPYKVVDVSRKWNSSSGFSVPNYSSDNTKGGYTFGLTVPQGAAGYKGQCATYLDSKSTSVLGIDIGNQNASVLCECSGAGTVSLTLTAGTTAKYTGKLAGRGDALSVDGIYDQETGASTGKPAGYQVRGQRPVGAVEVVGKGRVWLARTLEPAARADLACIFAGLLLYKPPQEL
jgi:hypothetical protein